MALVELIAAPGKPDHASGLFLYMLVVSQLGDDFASQARRTFANLVTTLEAAGCSAADVVHVTTYLTDRGDFEAFNHAFTQVFSA